VATAASGSPSPATGTTTNLSVLGADSDGGGEANLIYTWSTTGTPPAAVSFSANGINAAKNTTATFTKAGMYNFLVTITDLGGQSTTSSVSVTVNQTPVSLTVSPATPNITAGGSQQFTVSGQDQFGQTITNPTVTWSLTGPGSVSSDGLFTPAYAPGTATVTATSGTVGGSATVTVAGEARWNSATDASWGADGSWADSVSGTTIPSPGVRSIAGDMVLFATATGGVASLDGANPTLVGIAFDNSVTSYTIAPGSGGTITLQAAGGATVSVVSGNHTITAPLVLSNGANFATAASTRLAIGGSISGSGGFTKSGSGIVELSGTNSYTGDTTVTGGKLIVHNASALPDGGNLTIGDGTFFVSPSAPAPAAVLTSAPARATAIVPAPVAPVSPPKPATSSPSAAARGTILNQAAAATIDPARAAGWISRITGSSGSDDSSNGGKYAQIRDKFFAAYGQS
jgi:autotransporter-associated beta strand protein